MAVVTPAILRAASLNLRTVFHDAYETTTTMLPMLASTVNTDGPVERIMWTGVIPGFTEWIGDRKLGTLGAFYSDVEVKDWSDGVEVQRNDIEDNRLWSYNQIVAAMGSEAKLHKEDLLFDQLNAAMTTVGIDGQYHIDTDHATSDGVTVSNKGSGALAAGTLATAMARQYTNFVRGNRFRRLKWTHLLIPPALLATANDLIMLDRLSSGAANPNYNVVQIIVDGRLSAAAGGSDTAWYLLDSSSPEKPFVYLNRQDVRFAAQDRPEDEHAFMRKAFRYGADYRGNVAPAAWWRIYGSPGT